jgi:hypothetical protein
MSKGPIATAVVVAVLLVGGAWYLGLGPFQKAPRPGFEFRVTDHFGPFDKVEVRFGDIEILHESFGWQEVDLMDDEDDLEDVDISNFNSTQGQFHVLEADDDLPSGNYTQIMIELHHVRGVFAVNQSIVQFRLDDTLLFISQNFTIAPNQRTIVTVDFDLGLSIVQLGPVDFIFVPETTVRVEHED